MTWIGDSLMISSLLVLVFHKKTDFLLMLVVTVIITGLFTTFLKDVFFSEWDRPLKVFGHSACIHTVGKYKLFYHSFPSGHSVTVSTVFTIMACYFSNKKSRLVLFALLSIVVSYTRIYTGAHFPGDVLAGSMLGTFLSLLLIRWLAPKMKNWLEQWSNKTKQTIKIILMGIAVIGLIISVISIEGWGELTATI